MTDRELLELAAKAAGISLEWDGPPDKWQPMYYQGKTYHSFDPLTDDGAALRLAVQLRKLPVIERWSEGDDWVFIPGHEAGAEPLGNDPFAATRRAIVRAAAEIGKGLQPFPTAKEIREEWT